MSSDHEVSREAKLEACLQEFLNRMDMFGDWDDGCFYYSGRSASELQRPIEIARELLKRSENGQERHANR